MTKVQPVGKTLLIVDDEPGHVLTLESFLKERGFDVMIANDGQEALERIRARRPDLIVLDIMMPRMDGTELAMQMKDDPKLRAIPIIYITAVITAEDQVDSAGSDHFIFAKPVNYGLLLSKIREVLGLEN